MPDGIFKVMVQFLQRLKGLLYYLEKKTLATCISSALSMVDPEIWREFYAGPRFRITRGLVQKVLEENSLQIGK